MGVFNYIDPFYFFLAFSVGLIFTYLVTPTPTIIIKYPTPENAGKYVYKDKADVCYKYRAEEVDCPDNKDLVKEIPIQNGENMGIVDRLIGGVKKNIG